MLATARLIFTFLFYLFTKYPLVHPYHSLRVSEWSSDWLYGVLANANGSATALCRIAAGSSNETVHVDESSEHIWRSLCSDFFSLVTTAITDVQFHPASHSSFSVTGMEHVSVDVQFHPASYSSFSATGMEHVSVT